MPNAHNLNLTAIFILIDQRVELLVSVAVLLPAGKAEQYCGDGEVGAGDDEPEPVEVHRVNLKINKNHHILLPFTIATYLPL